VVNQLDDSARETFPTGRPLEDTPELQTCKICKKSVLKTAIAAHVEACIKLRNERLKKKKEQKEAREREKKMAAKGEDKDKDEDEEGDTKMEDEDEDVAADKKGPGGLKSTKKSAGKKIEVDDNKKGKKRKADGDAEKGPKQKKKKEEPKPKAPKQKGIVHLLLFGHVRLLLSPIYGLDRLLVMVVNQAPIDTASPIKHLFLFSFLVPWTPTNKHGWPSTRRGKVSLGRGPALRYSCCQESKA
jgi:hypothetical protein